MKNISAITWLLLPLVFSMPAFAHNHQAEPAAEHQSDSLFNITDTWTTSNEKPFHMAELEGGPAVIAMIYTSCKDICPLIVEDMKKIERLLPPEQAEKVHFAVFSFDSDRDNPKILKEYARAHGIDSSRWTIARNSPDAVRRLAVAIGMKYKKNKTGDFVHSELITILDKDGVIKYQQNDSRLSEDDAVLAIKHMLH